MSLELVDETEDVVNCKYIVVDGGSEIKFYAYIYSATSDAPIKIVVESFEWRYELKLEYGLKLWADFCKIDPETTTKPYCKINLCSAVGRAYRHYLEERRPHLPKKSVIAVRVDFLLAHLPL